MSRQKIHMEPIGQTIRAKRESMGLLLRQVASYLDIDQAILSKIERNERKPNKDIIIKLAEILEFDKEDLLVQFISERIAYEIVDEDCASKVLKAAEQKVNYLRSSLVKN
ncbi:Helix-turn-helix protein [Belliella baltica DSM 15883]|uniref:Helix-turn-helix protein n=1 Tax=Belliella baltica (strain DSM 15883 / CIP 108006 / LMG 21964 / BA134) TaxID=866536 RepID=I3Z625_BELBD|nr:helix-turn-helix transcriptional regulator [Belliella baltica]AFL84693.1 Helix-turn-helix protein [Belliella baltica DSM 15883]